MPLNTQLLDLNQQPLELIWDRKLLGFLSILAFMEDKGDPEIEKNLKELGELDEEAQSLLGNALAIKIGMVSAFPENHVFKHDYTLPLKPAALEIKAGYTFTCWRSLQ